MRGHLCVYADIVKHVIAVLQNQEGVTYFRQGDSSSDRLRSTPACAYHDNLTTQFAFTSEASINLSYTSFLATCRYDWKISDKFESNKK